MATEQRKEYQKIWVKEKRARSRQIYDAMKDRTDLTPQEQEEFNIAEEYVMQRRVYAREYARKKRSAAKEKKAQQGGN